MTLTTEQLDQLSSLINDRLNEFGIDGATFFEPISRGVVRMMYSAFEEWRTEEHDAVIEDYASAREQAYWRGHADGAMDERGKMACAAEHEAVRAAQIGDDSLAYATNGSNGALSFATTTNANGSTTTIIADGDWCDLVEDEAEPVKPDHPSDEPLFYPPGVGTDSDPYDAIVAVTLGVEHTLNTPLRPIGPGALMARLPDPDVARGRLAHAIAAGSDEARELVALTSYKPRTLAEMDEDDDSEPGHREMTPARRAQLDRLKHERRVAKETEGRPKGHNGNVLPTLDEVVRELQRVAMAGMMPSQTQFNDAKPANWATAAAHMQRLDKSWSELAELAGLKVRSVGRPLSQPQAA